MMSNALNILAYAIKKEEEGERFYEENLERIHSAAAKEVLEALKAMEKEHGELLKRRYEAASSGEAWALIFEDKPGDHIFQIRSKSENNTETDLNSALGDISILRTAYLIEEDLASFYKKAAAGAENEEDRELFEILASWEVQHRDMLYKVYMEHFHDNWFDAGFSPF
jgi:rubrerythrin